MIRIRHRLLIYTLAVSLAVAILLSLALPFGEWIEMDTAKTASVIPFPEDEAALDKMSAKLMQGYADIEPAAGENASANEPN